MKPYPRFCLAVVALAFAGCGLVWRPAGLELPYVLRPASAAVDRAALRDGTVSLAVLVDPAGRAVDWLVTDATAPACEQAAVAQLRQITFAPARLDGWPVPAHLGLVFTYAGGAVKLSATGVETLGDTPTAPVRQLDQLDARPRLLHEVRPQAGPGPGRVKLQFFIDRDGRVRLPMAIESDAPALSAAPLQAVTQSRSAPPHHAAHPVIALVRQEFRFGQ